MALRLRRGTDAERLLITPLQGELIYTTDTKLLYVGDGSTAGGTLVTGAGGGSTTLEALTDTNVSGAETGDVLSYNAGTNKWEPAVIPGLSGFGLSDLSDVFIDPNTSAPGDILKLDGAGNYTNQPLSEFFAEGANWRINIVGDDSTMLVDAQSSTLGGTLEGNVIGVVDGELKGSVFSDGSSLLVDGILGEIVGTVNNNDIYTGILRLSGTDNTGSVKAGILIETDGNAEDAYSLFDIVGATESEVGSAINFSRSRGTLASPTALQDEDEILGINYFGYDSNNSPQIAAVIQARVDGTPGSGSVPGTLALLTADSNGDINLGITLGADSVTRFWGPAKLYALADATARDAAITAPEAGMMIYLTATNKAQVYNGSTWNDLF